MLRGIFAAKWRLDARRGFMDSSYPDCSGARYRLLPKIAIGIDSQLVDVPASGATSQPLTVVVNRAAGLKR